MNTPENAIRNEKGSVLVIALVILVLITLMGIMVTTTSDIDIQIAKNEQAYMQEFYAAESAWREAIQWLDTRAQVPALVNKTSFVAEEDSEHVLNVRNFGNGGDGVFNADFDESTRDGALGTGAGEVNYWYRIAYLKTDSSMTDEEAMTGDRAPAGYSDDFRQYNFVITSVANGTQRIDVTVNKVFRVGSQGN